MNACAYLNKYIHISIYVYIQIYKYICLFIYMYISSYICVNIYVYVDLNKICMPMYVHTIHAYGVASISRLIKITGLFSKRAL